METQIIINLVLISVIAFVFFELTTVITNWLKKYINVFELDVKEEEKKTATSVN